MDFFRGLAIQFFGTAVLGALAAYMARHLGVDKHTILVGMIGIAIGWFACWLWHAWSSQPQGVVTGRDPRLDRKAPLEEPSDKTRHIASASQRIVLKDEV